MPTSGVTLFSTTPESQPGFTLSIWVFALRRAIFDVAPTLYTTRTPSTSGIMIDGSLPGPAKRLVRLKKSVTNRNGKAAVKTPKVAYVSTVQSK